jgi:CubicO group peptidase (beta-lactamase class C family)
MLGEEARQVARFRGEIAMRRLIALAAALACLALPAAAQVFQPIAPAEAGFDPARLTRLDDFLNAAVAEGRMPGFGVLLARHGRLVSLKNYGKKNLVTGEAIAPDTIFRIASMSKMVTGVALLILYEENKFNLDDPVAKFIPEFADLKVYAGTGPDGRPILVDPVHAPTMRELMSHSGGFGYSITDHPADKLLAAEKPYDAPNLHEFVRRVAKAPLIYQPGTTWRYSSGADISGYIVEKLSGMSFGQFLQTRLFGALGMKDSGFYVPPAKLARLAPVYAADRATGRFAEVTGSTNPIGLPVMAPTAPPAIESGGGGLFSTLMDYARLAQMLGNGGELDGVRILAPATVEMMGTNMIAQEALMPGIPRPPVHFDRNIGFGLDVQVMLHPRAAGSLVGKGTMSWHGAFAGWWWVDPTDDIVCVGMAQRSGTYPDYVFDDIEQVQKLVYQALTHPGR